jgi:hypothetical protein
MSQTTIGKAIARGNPKFTGSCVEKHFEGLGLGRVSTSSIPYLQFSVIGRQSLLSQTKSFINFFFDLLTLAGAS